VAGRGRDHPPIPPSAYWSEDMNQVHSRTNDRVVGLAGDILENYAGAARGSKGIYGHDSGPIVLANVAHSVDALPKDLMQRVARRWFHELPYTVSSLGSFGGLGGFIAGVRALIAIDDEFSRVSDDLRTQTRRLLSDARWRTSAVAWVDYDLFRGPAGLVLAGASDTDPTEPFCSAARHLALLCDDPGLEGLRAGTEISSPSAFNIGRINTGMGHGVTGVASALRHAVETFEDGSDYRPALRRACDWLVEEAYLADHDFITWPPVGRDGARASGAADRRQAWCYGTPGVAWTLWEGGRVLGDTSLQLLGEEAMRSFCRVFNADCHFHIYDIAEELAICHGAAGTLAVADAFARYAALREAAELRDELYQYLLDHVDRIADIAKTDMTILSGAGGIVSAMLSVHGGARSWLCQVALR
jgi:lantibiotic biosynthesis protein